MALTLKPHQTQTTPTVAAPLAAISQASAFEVQIRQAVDTAVEAERHANELKGEFEARDKARKDAQQALVDLYNTQFDDDMERLLNGNEHQIKMGKRVVTRKVKKGSMAAVRTMLEKVKKGLYLEVAGVAMKALETHLTPDELDEVLESTVTKRRSMKTLY